MTEECPHYPFTRSSPLTRQDALTGLRDRPVVKVTLPSGDQAYLVTRHRDVQKLLGDPRLRKDRKYPEDPRMSRDNAMLQNPRISQDPPRHPVVRRLISKAFTPARLEQLRPKIERMVEGPRSFRTGTQ